MAKFNKRADGTEVEVADTAAEDPASSPDVTAAAPVANAIAVAPAAVGLEPMPIPPVASTALGADKISAFDPIFGAFPNDAPAPVVAPVEDLPVQTDRPSYDALVAAALAHKSITIRQIRTRPSNMVLVGGIHLSRTIKTVSLDDVLERGRGAIRDLADDDTIEVYIVAAGA